MVRSRTFIISLIFAGGLLFGLSFFVPLVLANGIASSNPTPSPVPSRVPPTTLEVLKSWDFLRGRRMREPIPGDTLRLPSGLQVHPQCIEYASKYEGLSKAEIRDLFTKTIEQTADIAVSCQKRYPELEPYLRDWATQFRRTAITCKDKTNEEMKSLGKNPQTPLITVTDLSTSEAAGLFPKGTSPMAPLASKTKTVVILPKNFLSFGSNDFNGIYLLFHEILHSTHANNRSDHNKLQTKRSTPESPCDDEWTQDRISVISSLCAGPVYSNHPNTEEAIYQKVKDCGFKAGCTKMFRNKPLPLIPNSYYPSLPLEEAGATSVCNRIFAKGMCRTYARENGRLLLANSSRLKNMQGKLADRLDELLPKDGMEIPLAVLKTDERFSDILEQTKNSKCFTEVFETPDEDTLRLKKPGPYQPVKQKEIQSVTSLWILNARKNILDAECDSGVRSKLDYALLRAGEKIQSALGSNRAQMVLARASGLSEMAHLGPMMPFIESDYSFRRLLGAELFDEYWGIIKKEHWLSPDFDCEGAGFFLKEATIDAIRKLEEQSKNPFIRCP